MKQAIVVVAALVTTIAATGAAADTQEGVECYHASAVA
jgi:hypothetical protein